MELNYFGIVIGLVTFLVIGLFHPLVIKAEYYLGVKSWWLFLLLGIAASAASLLVSSLVLSIILGVVAFSSFWSIGEVFAQKKRVEKGWFPKNPKTFCCGTCVARMCVGNNRQCRGTEAKRGKCYGLSYRELCKWQVSL